MDAESQLIARIAKIVSSTKGRPAGAIPRIGIGDDAAVLAPRAGKELVVTCDSFFEGVHFLADVHPPESVGYKSLARAASDIVAMGASPRWFLLALALPTAKTGGWLDRFSAGMARAARELGLTLIGGDTSRLAKISMNITVIGEIAAGRAVLRSGARPGDLIYVSGRLGEAQLGLEWMRLGLAIRGRNMAFLRQHLYPRIPVVLGEWLARHRVPSAMMDISDGLSTDLPRLCEMSGVGARIEAAKLPCVEVPRHLPAALRRARLDPVAMALHGGDDYGLLFTVPRRKAGMLRRAPGDDGLACIGEITRERKILLVDAEGKAKPLASHGWDPFRSR
jgi:thiamine-monophosphate kinase